MKDSMFQFASRYKIFEDTGLITLDEAKEMWRENKEKFIREFEAGTEPEMVIWIECGTAASYGESIWHVDFESIIKDGEICKVVIADNPQE